MKEISETRGERPKDSQNSADTLNSASLLDTRIWDSVAHSCRNRGLSDSETARLLGRNNSESGDEGGGMPVLTVSQLIQVCEVIGASLDEIFLRVVPDLVVQNNADLRARLSALDPLLELDTETLAVLRAVAQHLLRPSR